MSSGSATASVNKELVADSKIAAAPLAGPTPVVAPGGTVAGRATLASPKLYSSTAGKPCIASHSSGSSSSSARVSSGPAAYCHGTAGEVIALCVLYIFAGEERQADV